VASRSGVGVAAALSAARASASAEFVGATSSEADARPSATPLLIRRELLPLGLVPLRECVGASSDRLLPLVHRDDRGDQGTNGQQDQARDGRSAPAAESALLVHVVAGEFVLGLPVDRSGQVGDLVTEGR